RSSDPVRLAQQNGLLSHRWTVRYAEITDGTSNTILAGERAHSRLDEPARSEWHWWSSGVLGDTLFTSLYPVNPFQQLPDSAAVVFVIGPYICAASSMHPGGANFAFADVSVRFIKESIDTWSNDPQTGLPPGITFDGVLYHDAGARWGVYQKLTTRNFG